MTAGDCALRASIIAESRSWIGTRFQHQGRVKKNYNNNGGCDCIGLIVGVFHRIQHQYSMEYIDTLLSVVGPNYNSCMRYDDVFVMLQKKISLKEPCNVKNGDIAICCIRGAMHFAIKASKNKKHSIIHAYHPASSVVEHPVDCYWNGVVRHYFSLINI